MEKQLINDTCICIFNMYQAFGVGAFEDDDEDIYSKDDMSQYDFSELEVKRLEDSHKTIGKSLNKI